GHPADSCGVLLRSSPANNPIARLRGIAMFCAPCPDRTREAPSPKLTSRTWRSAGSWFGWGVGCVVFEGVPGQGFESWSLVVGAIDGASGQEHDTGQGQECFGTDLVCGVHGMWTGIIGWIL